MGAWGSGSFDNDDAMDFVGELAGAGLEPVDAALDAVLDGDAYVEAPVASAALAAAEAVAVLRGRPAATVPPEVLEWAKIGTRLRLSPTFFEKAKKAAQRVKDHSELKELWDESKDAKEWSAKVEELIGRLATG